MQTRLLTTHRAAAARRPGSARVLIVVALVAVGGVLYLLFGFGAGRTQRGSADGPVAPRAEAPVEAPAADARELAATADELVPGRRAEPAPAPPAPDAAEFAPAPAETLADDVERGPGELMERIRKLRRGEDPSERLALAREVLAEDQTSPMTLHALEAIAELEPESAAEELRRLIERGGEDLRARGVAASAIRMLGRYEDALDSESLAAFYELGENDVKLAVASTLEARGDSSLSVRYQEACAERLTSDDDRVRAEAVRNLSATRSDAATNLILPLLSDDSEEVRMEALRAVAQGRRDPGVLDELRPLLDDPSERVSRTASRIVESLERRLEAERRLREGR